MRTVCVLCVYICTLTVSVQFSRGQPGKPVCTDGTDVTRTTARNWRPDQSHHRKSVTGQQTDKQTDSGVYRVAPQLKKEKHNNRNNGH